MSNVNNLTSKILKDAEDKKVQILNKANSDKEEIISKRVSKAKEVEAEIIEKAKSEATTKKARIISSAELKVRNNKLAAKQNVIKEVFEESVDKLATLSNDEFLKFVKETILALNIDGDEVLILNEVGNKLIDNKFLEEVNKELGEKGKLTLSTETRNFKGGFILEKNGIEINNTYEALVSSLKDELEFEVANVLFN